jgi:hemerythrin superfamily protein
MPSTTALRRTNARHEGRLVVEGSIAPALGDIDGHAPARHDERARQPATPDGGPMNKMMSRFTPSAPTMLKMDHTHALMTFHRYHANTTPARKRAIVDTLCTALEIHAKLEEEIFYPAMRTVDPDLVQDSYNDHGEMKALIEEVQRLRPADRAFDTTLMQLMRVVIKHVADEETKLFPDAERVLGEERLAELGAEMTRRRMQLVGPRAGQIAVSSVRTFPAAAAAMTGAIAIGGYLIARAFTKPTGMRALVAKT